MLGGKCFEFTDDRAGAPARDFSFCAGDLGQNIVFGQRGGEHLDEREVVQVIQYWPAPFGQCGRKVAASLF